MRLPERPPSIPELLSGVSSERFGTILLETRPVDYKGRYLHWDDMRNRTPPTGMDHREWWLTTALARQGLARELPFVARDGVPFRFANIDAIQEKVHYIDQRASGEILADDVVTNLRSSDRYLVSSLVEEAITSSQLEGASTTRRVAKEMLASGREPRDTSEQMIVNNYRAMLYIQDLAREEIGVSDVLDIHRILTDKTLKDPEDAGRLQSPGDERVAVFWRDGTLLHRPPDATELPSRLDALCRFANGEHDGGFIHPVVRAVIIHFCLGYDHPFVDGNGRTARALFYWAMLHDKYWLAQYLTISSILRKAPAKYARSYLLTETGDHDVTYFVLYHLDVIIRAIEALHQYLARKMREMREIETLIHGFSGLNNRQLVVIQNALRDPAEPILIAAQMGKNRVTYESARSDLTKLESLGLLSKARVGKRYEFRPVPDLPKRLRELGAAARG